MSVTVSVIMLTYNHAPYIAQAVESVLAQRTTFPIELIIADDCSTDGTTNIVRRYTKGYPDRIRLLTTLHNLGALNNERRAIDVAQGTYLAFCEGDDYWHAPNKLALQVAFLEQNPGYGIVHSDFDIVYQSSGNRIAAHNSTKHIEIPAGDILDQLFIPSHLVKVATALLRRKLFVSHFSFELVAEQGWLAVDLAMWLSLAPHTKIGYILQSLATYRLLNESISRSQDPRKLHAFHQSVFDIRRYFAEKYMCASTVRNSIEQAYNCMLIVDGFSLGDGNMILQGAAGLKQAGQRLTLTQRLVLCSASHTSLLRALLHARAFCRRMSVSKAA